MTRRSLYCLVVVVGTWLGYEPQVYANNFDKGITAYRRADFAGAEAAFKAMLGEGHNRLNTARAYKYLGLSQYMLGKKDAARLSFYGALKYNPRTELFPDEVLDSSVIEFFLEIKSSLVRGGGGAKVAVPVPPPSRPKPPIRAPAVKKPIPRKAPAISRPAVKKPSPKKSVVRKKLPTRTKSRLKKSARPSKPAPKVVRKKKKKRGSMFAPKRKKPPRIVIEDKKVKEDDLDLDEDIIDLPSDSRRRSSDSSPDILRALPFGVGQYMNGSNKLGHLFAAGGVLTFGAFLFLTVYEGIERDWAELDAYEEDLASCKGLGKNHDCRTKINDSGYTTEKELEIYLNDTKEYLDGLTAQSYLWLGGFVAIWIGGVIEAYVNKPKLDRYSLYLPDVRYYRTPSSVFRKPASQHHLALVWQFSLAP